jgi:hypothetical protein
MATADVHGPIDFVLIEFSGDRLTGRVAEELFDDLDRRAIGLVLASVRTSVLTTLRRLGLEDRLGARNIHLSIRGAVSGVTGQADEPMDPALVPEPRAARGSSPVGEDHAGAEADASKNDR